MATSTFSSRDHILKIQKLTKGGLVLVASHKKPHIADLRFFDDVTSSGGFKIRYFINCVFPKTILSKDHRLASYSIKPGFRHDLTLDFEKKTKDARGRWIKDTNVTQTEKRELLAVLEQFSWVGWAGCTPHGVHAGIYFDEWTQKSDTRCIIAWVEKEIKKAGYKGKIAIDFSPSVNYNRPSRFLDEFAFFRPDSHLDARAIVAANTQLVPKSVEDSITPGLKDQAVRTVAFKCRANMMTKEETAAIIGQPVQWVDQLWTANRQTAFNPFNEDLKRLAGPKTFEGFTGMNKKLKKELYRNASWSWQWCWHRKMDAAAAKLHVFTNPDFEELLTLLEQAYLESVQMNQGVPYYKTWRAWVEKDIERCWKKFGKKGDYVKPSTVASIGKAITFLCKKHPGKNTVAKSEVAAASPFRNRKTIGNAFRELGLTLQGKARASRYLVPAGLLPTPGLAPAIAAKGLPPPTTTCAMQIFPKNDPTPALLEEFWKGLFPPIQRPPMNPCPVGDFYLPEINRRLSPAYKTHSEWRQLAAPDTIKMDYGLKDDLMYVVRRFLSINGHVYHPLTGLLTVLRQILGKDAEFYYIWLVVEGYVVNVSEKMVGDAGAWVAWKGNLLGEVRFAWRVVEHCHHGGRIVIFCGEPGTGKTQKLAERLAAEKGNAVGGSAQHASANLLTARLKGLGCNHRVGTVHHGYKVMKVLRRGDTKVMRRNLYYADELGQLDCDTAGAMAMRWKPGAELLFSIGVGQNLPVGAGCVGEDFVGWLKSNADKLPNCQLPPLTENHRTKNDPNAKGIVECFRAVGRGELPTDGPGMTFSYCDDESDVIDKTTLLGKKLGAQCLTPTRSSAHDVNCGFIALDRYDSDLDFTDLSYHKDEKLVVQHAGERALKAGLRNDTEVIVAEDTVSNFDPKQLIKVWRPQDGKGVELEMREIARPYGRTGHGAQGLERDAVVVGVITTKATTRRWLYTAVSRARKTCVVVCTRAGLEKCVASNPQRRTLLPKLLDRAVAVFAALPKLDMPEVKTKKRRARKSPAVAVDK